MGGVKGLYISMWPDGRRSWILRTTHNGKRANFGLGSCDTVSLSVARKEARKVYEELLDGVDRREVRKAERIARKRDRTFEQVAEEFLQTSVFTRVNANEKNKRQLMRTPSGSQGEPVTATGSTSKRAVKAQKSFEQPS